MIRFKILAYDVCRVGVFIQLFAAIEWSWLGCTFNVKHTSIFRIWTDVCLYFCSLLLYIILSIKTLFSLKKLLLKDETSYIDKINYRIYILFISLVFLQYRKSYINLEMFFFHNWFWLCVNKYFIRYKIMKIHWICETKQSNKIWTKKFHLHDYLTCWTEQQFSE